MVKQRLLKAGFFWFCKNTGNATNRSDNSWWWVFPLQKYGSLMGDYGNIDQAVEKAKIIQQDLLREEQYGGNNYNLGEIDGTAGGMTTIAPLAIFTALYRPLFFEIGSPLMVISALENTILLFSH